MKASYQGWQGGYWSSDAIQSLISKFPEGQIVIKSGGVVIGCALSLIVDYKKFGDVHTYKEITGNYTFNTHTRKGDVLYGIEIFIHPDYRGLTLGKRLYDARKDLCENRNLRAVVKDVEKEQAKFGNRVLTSICTLKQPLEHLRNSLRNGLPLIATTDNNFGIGLSRRNIL